MKKTIICSIILLLLLISTILNSAATFNDNSSISITSGQFEKGYRYNIQGWIYLHVEGEPYERGFQHGYLLSAEIVDMFNRWSNTIHNYRLLKYITPNFSEERYYKISELWWNFCTRKCVRMYADKFPEEYRLEMQGIADGVNHAGGQIHNREVTYNDILTLNEMYEFISKMERIPKRIHPIRTFINFLQKFNPEISTLNDNPENVDIFLGDFTHHCSGFVATGNATTDGQIVISDSMWCGPGSWWWNYYISLRWNILLDIVPDEGHRILMASSPGFIWSDHDFYQNDEGLALIETTCPQGLYDNVGLPLSVRARTAMQYAEDLDEVAETLIYRNDGAMNSVWLIADAETGEIGRLDLGYRQYSLEKTFNGFYWSANNPEDLGVRIEKVEWKKIIYKFIRKIIYDEPGFGYHSIFYRPETRDIKFEELGNEFYGQIDVDIVKQIMSTSPISDWSTDCKLTDSYLIENNGMCAFFGNPTGMILNLTNVDKPDRTIEKIHPTGWVRLFGLPEKNDFILQTNKLNNENETTVIWDYNTESTRNDFYASFEIANDTLVSSTSEGKLYAFYKENGTKKWDKNINSSPTKPVIFDNNIYVGTKNGLYVYDLEGDLNWKINITQIVATPQIYEDKLIFSCKDGKIFCYSLENKSELWNLSLDYEPYISNPIDGKICITSGDTLFTLSINNSDILWNFKTNLTITSPPIIQKNTVFFGSWDNVIYALNLSDGNMSWIHEIGWGLDTSPTFYNDKLFFSSTDNNLYVLNSENGSLDKIFTSNSAIHSSPFVYSDFVFFGSDDGRFYAVNITNGNNWVFSPGFTTDDDVYNYQTTPILSSPIVENDMVFIGIKGKIYALNVEVL